ncbi:MAG: ATP-binding protein [Candidatus Hydrogenedentes bacterium]|nr:ATP-binding protein [Candidatus Hydrogenedentota bacterium]
MNIPENELLMVLQEFNPWWVGKPPGDLPRWERAAVQSVRTWLRNKTVRSLLLTGARQTGKTTVFRQTIQRLVDVGRTLETWNSIFPAVSDHPRILFLDEIQFVPDWQTWLKHQVDFHREHRIAVTGSASPLRGASAESGVGRWETVLLPTLSFGEFLQLRGIETPTLAEIDSLQSLFDWTPADFARTGPIGRDLIPHFHEYLLWGGFPEPALSEDLSRCQRLLREDVVDKMLKRDMTALYGVRRVIEVEKLFLYLCYHDGGIIDISAIARELDGINRPLVQSFLDLFEAGHLIYRLKPFGYGKEILRGRDKVYLADAALAGAILVLGRRLLEQPERLGAAVETAFFKHLFARYYAESQGFSYWRDRKHHDYEVDVVAQLGNTLVPFEVKYQDTEILPKRLRGLRQFMNQRNLEQSFVITRRWADFGIRSMETTQVGGAPKAKVLLLPAPLACLWLSP